MTLTLSSAGYCSLLLPLGYSGAPQTRASSGAANTQNPPEKILFATKNPDGAITKRLTDEEITALMPKIPSLDDVFAYKPTEGQSKRVAIEDKNDAFETVIDRMLKLETMLLRLSRRHGLSYAELSVEFLSGGFLKGQNLSVKV
ncbi:MAG: hypothetical protein LBU73_10000 [Helicobacteraceae bacterium]|jgi:hypothetical protein|nr:hypothetical protein [Helicobacteraceae bacterium]